MTSSSSRPDAPGRVLPTPKEWSWAELEPGGHVGEVPERAEEAREARHRAELEEAYRRGVREGEASARARARTELASAMSVALGAMDEVNTNRSLWASTARENLVALSAAIARQIVERELALDPSIFVDTAQRAVAAFPADEPLRIRVHPSDLETLEAADAVSVGDVVGERNVRWVLDEGMVPGGCVVEGPDRIVDGRIDEALARVVRELNHA